MGSIPALPISLGMILRGDSSIGRARSLLLQQELARYLLFALVVQWLARETFDLETPVRIWSRVFLLPSSNRAAFHAVGSISIDIRSEDSSDITKHCICGSTKIQNTGTEK